MGSTLPGGALAASSPMKILPSLGVTLFVSCGTILPHPQDLIDLGMSEWHSQPKLRPPDALWEHEWRGATVSGVTAALSPEGSRLLLDPGCVLPI